MLYDYLPDRHLRSLHDSGTKINILMNCKRFRRGVAASVYRAGFVVLAFLAAGELAAQPVKKPHVEAELIAENTAIQPGQPFRVALRLRMEKDWHTYWSNPGDAGMATSIEWKLPEGYTAGEIEWPYPEMMGEAPEVSYGYSDEILLPVTITPPPGLPAMPDVTLSAKASWLVCKEVCIPGSADLHLALPVDDAAPVADPRWSSLFDAIHARLPRPLVGWSATAQRTVSGYRLRLVPESPSLAPPSQASFFAGEEAVIDHSAAQDVQRAEREITIDLASSPYASSPADRLRGLLYAADGWGQGAKAVEIDIPVE